MGYTSIVWKGQTIPVTRITVGFQPGTLKQKNGRALIQAPMLLRNVLDKVLEIEFQFRSNLDTERTTLETSNDATRGAYTDGGVNNGDYVMIPESLQFSDDGARKNLLEGKFTLTQYQQ